MDNLSLVSQSFVPLWSFPAAFFNDSLLNKRSQNVSQAMSNVKRDISYPRKEKNPVPSFTSSSSSSSSSSCCCLTPAKGGIETFTRSVGASQPQYFSVSCLLFSSPNGRGRPEEDKLWANTIFNVGHCQCKNIVFSPFLGAQVGPSVSPFLNCVTVCMWVCVCVCVLACARACVCVLQRPRQLNQWPLANLYSCNFANYG